MLQMVKNRDRSTLRKSGPCFKCHEQTIYGDGNGGDLCNMHVQFGDTWLNRAFANGFIRTRQDGQRQVTSPYPPYYVMPYLCIRCRDELDRDTKARKKAEAEAKDRREAEAKAREQFEKTWRKPKPGEFPDERGEKCFLVVEEDFGYQEVVVRYRVSRRWCVGSRPVFIYAMFVDGKLEARTYHDSAVEHTDPVAVCFGIWFENRWQDKLAASEHVTDVWQAKAPGRSNLDSWLWECSGQGAWEPWSLIHTIWTDGSIYAAVENMRTIENVQDFATKVLEAQVIPVKGRRSGGFSAPSNPRA